MEDDDLNSKTVSINNINYWGIYPNGKDYNHTFFNYTIPLYNPLLYTYAVYQGYVYDSNGNFIDIKNNISILECKVFGVIVSVTFNSTYFGRLLRIELGKSN